MKQQTQHVLQQRFRMAALLVLCFVPLRMALAESADEECAKFRSSHLGADQIALQTKGAIVRSSSMKSKGNTRYCRLRGEILPVDTAAAPIRFQVNLPSVWNGKAVQFGGAVFDGFLGYSDGTHPSTIGLKRDPTALQQGYATYGSDSGHHPAHPFLPGVIDIFNASFATNQEQQANFIKDALKKTHDVAYALMQQRYGTKPKRSFFLGSSSGGHEALEMVQNWPDDYDGVLSGYPAWSGTELALQFLRTSQALYSPGGFLTTGNTKLLARSVLRACDKLDGLADGIVSNVNACRFDPRTLLCSATEQKGCLTDAQLNTVQTFATEQRTSFVLKNGVQSMPGYNVLAGAELSRLMLGVFHHPEHHPRLLFNAVNYTIADRAVRNFVTQRKGVDALSIDPATGGPYQSELTEVSARYDASDFDLSRFAARGGKLLLIHGTADVVIPTGSSVMYYERVQQVTGFAQTDSFMRFYLVPGFGHGTGTFVAGMDALGVLDAWNATGIPPSTLTTTDQSKRGRRRSRPLCVYPEWPRYTGAGDPDQVSSFVCTQPDLVQNAEGAATSR